MKLDEIRALNDADARTRLTELQEEQFRLRFRSATETLESPLRLREVRRDIARALTVLGEKGRGVEPAPQATAKTAKGAKTAKTATKKTATKGTAKTAATKSASKRAAKTAGTKTAR